jgi:adenylylsulfate kinase-like enzyme
MAKQLVHPGVLDESLRSGLFLSGLRRTGKTTLAQALTEVVDQAKTNVVVIVDEVQHAITIRRWQADAARSEVRT